ncbi:Translin-associated protein X [Hypsizygus marmoreus]|uniref:Translin-associated protein X n=1 Tax=Hypsizygus marmoreus TaxID=39966 RepID=A0A369K9L9_HYPMA|nr:Translin-associated protein X [Hypsizygus marmoreus]
MPAVADSFDAFRADLDDYNDRRERLIKASRDITNLSKKVIFLLHRLVLEGATDDPNVALNAATRAREKLRDVQNIYASLRHELSGDRFWRYQRQVSPGLQEYIEALSFAHYLEHGTLITFQQVQDTLCDPDGVPYFPLTVSDYLLGLSDLTGELMRFAISAIARRGGRAKAHQVCAFVRNCKADFERMTPYVRDLSKKQAVTAQSLEKIEDAAYAITVRGSEYDLPQDMLDDLVAQSISRFGIHDDRRRDDKFDDDEGGT